jgi:flavin reductase (DIM6/NTAB) family NADH-FMN oxidoreductase RutF
VNSYRVEQAPQELISKFIFNAVVPRPIAWITTLSGEGVVNLAPFSFFNAVTTKPPLLMVSIGKRKSGELKDTARNVLDTGELVVNVVSEEFLKVMHLSGKDFPPTESEAEKLGVELEPSLVVKPPRVKGVPASMECVVEETLELGSTPMLVVVARVVAFHYREGLLSSQKGIVGRLGGKRYCVVCDELDLSDLT